MESTLQQPNNYCLVCADWRDSYTTLNIVKYAPAANYFSYLEICYPIKKKLQLLHDFAFSKCDGPV